MQNLRFIMLKNKAAEIKVYENSDPEILWDQFCEKYNLGLEMRKQLLTIISNKLDSLKAEKTKEEIKEEDKAESNNDDSGEDFDHEALKHYQDELEEGMENDSKESESK